MMPRRVVLAVAAVVLLVPSAGWAQDEATVEISAVDDSFEPATAGIGTSGPVVIRWTNTGEHEHTVTADGGSFDSGVLLPGDSFRVELSEPRSIEYHCSIHGGPGGVGMAGALTVADVGAASSGGDPFDETTGGRSASVGNATSGELATSGWADVPAAGLVMVALSIMALGAYLTQIERIVYPERFR